MLEMRELIEVIRDNTKSQTELKAALTQLYKGNELVFQGITSTINAHDQRTAGFVKTVEDTIRVEGKLIRHHVTIKLLISAAALTAAFGAGVALAKIL